ncbi:Ig-like domain-containing protein [Actinoplanes philippinensis]|uniref:Ig-like domain-containing protein n=1 Tax=Actinoplanes philippinensis TaxID=35752 RepID=UPI0033DA3045
MRRTSRGAVALLTLAAALTAGPAATPAYAVESPVIDFGLSAGQYVNKTVVITPTIAEDSDVSRVVLYADDKQVTADNAAPWSLSWNTLGSFDGDWRLQLGVIDSAGVETRSETVTVTVINRGAVAYFPWPDSLQRSIGNTFTGVKEFDLIVSPHTKLDTVTRVDLLLNDKVIDSATAAPWTVTWDTTGPDGLVTLRTKTYDILGNVGTSKVYAYVDRTPPSLEVGYDEVDGYVNRNGRIYIGSEDPSAVDRVELWVNGKLIGTDRSICCNGLGAIALPFDRTAVNGPATMTVRSYDEIGNIAEHTRTVTVDNDGPAVTFTPAANALVRGTFTAALTSVKDATGITYLSGYINDLVYTHRAPWSVRIDTRSVADGRRTLRIDVQDKAGNVTTIRRPVTVDNTAPAIKYTKAPTNKAKVTKTFKITTAASDRYGIARVQLLVNGKVVATDTKAAYAFTVNPKKYGKKFTVQLRAYDKAGNVKYTAKRTYRR